MVRFLIVDHHCDPKVRSNCYGTPLDWACSGESIDIVKFLINHNCNPECHGRDGVTPLHLACYSGRADFVKFFVEKCHCNPRVQDRYGDTPLHLACMRGRTDIVRFLIVDHHCNPACRGGWGRTPLYYACSSEKLDLVKFLVEECHCDPFKGRHNKSPLHPAVHREDDILLFLLSYTPPLKEVDSAIKFYSQQSICKFFYSSVNPLSPNVADLQHFDIELFCGFSLYNAFCPSAEFITVSVLVLPLSQALVIKAGYCPVYRRRQLSKQRRRASDNVNRTVQVKQPLYRAYLE